MRPVYRFPALAVAALALAGLACNAFVTSPPAAPAAPVVVTQVVTAPAPVSAPAVSISSSEEEALIALYQRVDPAVVSIAILTELGSSAGSTR